MQTMQDSAASASISPFEAQKLFSAPPLADPAKSVETYWRYQSAKCKDMVCVAVSLKQIPANLDKFKEQGSEFVRSSFQIVYVPPIADWSCWSRVPYDSKKKLPQSELMPLYQNDDSGIKCFSFEKHKNNLNKGPRVETLEDKDVCFTLKAGLCASFFLREDSYDTLKIINSTAVGEIEYINAYQPVLLHVSGANADQAINGNGLKLRKMLPLQAASISPYLQFIPSVKQNVMENAEKLGSQLAINKVCGRGSSEVVISSKISTQAFIHQDAELKEKAMLEIVDSKVDEAMCETLEIPEKLLLEACHSQNLQRSIRMIMIAIQHDAVTCMISSTTISSVAEVRFLHVDWMRVLHINSLTASSSTTIMSSFPDNASICMKLGKKLQSVTNEDAASVFSEADKSTVLHWYNPSLPVIITDFLGREKQTFYLFELEIQPVQNAGAENSDSFFLQDNGIGFHNKLTIYTCDSPKISENDTLDSQDMNNCKLYLTWQLRSGCKMSSSATLNAKTARKRPFFDVDNGDQAVPPSDERDQCDERDESD